MENLKQHFGKYDIIYIDPPWSYTNNSKNSNNKGAADHYDLMTDADIKAMPIKDLFQDPKKGACFVWATCPKLDLAIHAIESWGLHYRGIAQVWVKTRKDGGIIGAQGVPPTAVKPTTELLLLATTCKRGRPFKLLSSKIPQVLLHPRGGHSEKPACVRDTIVEIYGDRPRIEMFCRHNPEGWAAWGNQVGKLC